MADDLDEFVDTARGVLRKAFPPISDRDDEVYLERKEMKDTPSQWSRGNGGYFPANPTAKKLPAGVYYLTPTNYGTQWKVMNISTDSLYRLPDTKSDEVISEIEQFWKLADEFKKYGFTHKRGYLLWGPPGSGKSSTIAFIIKMLIETDGIIIMADNPPKIVSQALRDFRLIEPDRPVVVIWEDIDTIIMRYGETEVLSILDGESSIDKVVHIATTNYPENLDGRVVNRPSRFDRIVKIGLPNQMARKDYLMKKIGRTDHEGYDLVKETEGLSIAHVKELIVGVFCQKLSIAEMLERLKKMKTLPKSTDDGNKIGIS